MIHRSFKIEQRLGSYRDTHQTGNIDGWRTHALLARRGGRRSVREPSLGGQKPNRLFTAHIAKDAMCAPPRPSSSGATSSLRQIWIRIIAIKDVAPNGADGHRGIMILCSALYIVGVGTFGQFQIPGSDGDNEFCCIRAPDPKIEDRQAILHLSSIRMRRRIHPGTETASATGRPADSGGRGVNKYLSSRIKHGGASPFR
jgi:hypothetical protein